MVKHRMGSLRIAKIIAFAAVMYAAVAGVSPVSAVDYNTIPGGQATAQNLDTGCYWNYWNQRNAGNTNLKSVTNGSAYNGMDWLSASGNTGQTTISVNAGSTDPIKLRINHLDYICYVATGDGTNSLAVSDARMASPAARSGADINPAPWRGFQTSPNRTFYGFGLYGIGASIGTISAYDNGAQIISARNDATRFWHVSSEFTYQPPAGGFQSSQDVTVYATVAKINQYYYRNNPRTGWEIACSSPPNKWNDTGTGTNPGSHSSLPDRWFTDQCPRETMALTFRVEVPYNYNLMPYVTRDAATVSQGSDVTFEHFVDKTGTNSRSTEYAVRQIVIPPGGTFNKNVDYVDNAYQGNENCPAVYGANASCRAVALATGSTTFTDKQTTISVPANVATINTSGYEIGTVICRILAVHPPTHNPAPGHRWSKPACVTVTKSPYIAVTNGDAWAGGTLKDDKGVCKDTTTRGFVGTRSSYQDGTYGSYGEYGVLSLKEIKGFGSAGKPQVSTTIGNKLSFRNTPSPFGNFASAPGHCLNNLVDYFGDKKATYDLGSLSAFNVNGANGVFTKASGTLRLTASDPALQAMTLKKNNQAIIIAEGDIIIEKNIEFESVLYANTSELPSLIVISRSGSIRISHTVTRLDGLYQAYKSFSTCLESEKGPIGEDSAVCKRKLTVNGAVISPQLILRRTYGAAIGGGTDLRNEPAEHFILRPDMYLRAYGQAQKTGQLRSVDENELPPRY